MGGPSGNHDCHSRAQTDQQARMSLSFGCWRKLPAPLRGTPTAQIERTNPLPRASVLRRCSPTDAPSPQQQPGRAGGKPLRTGLVSVAGDLHVRIDKIDAVNVHVSISGVPNAGQQELVSFLQPEAPDAVDQSAAVAATDHHRPPLAPSLPPFSCVGTMTVPGVFTVVMCSDGHSFVCGCESSKGPDEVQLYDVRSPEQRVAPVLMDNVGVGAVAVSENTTQVVVAGDRGLWRWDPWQLNAVELLYRGPDHDHVVDDTELEGAAVTPDGRFAVAGGFGKVLQVWDLQNETCIASVYPGGQVYRAAIAPDGRTAAALVLRPGAGKDVTSSKTSIWLWKWSAEFGFATPVRLPRIEWSMGSALSADGSVLITAEYCGNVRRWDSRSGEAVNVFQQAGGARCAAFSKDGRRAVLVDSTNSLRVWDVLGGSCIATLRHGDKEVSHTAISADGRHAVSYSLDDSRACVWHLG